MGHLSRLLCIALAGIVVAGAGPAAAEIATIRISYGYGLNFLPLYVMEHEHLLESQARAAGLGDVTVTWRILDGGNVINDAMLAGAVDIAAIGETGFLALWAKAKGTSSEPVGVSGVGGGPIWLMTRNPTVKTLRDFTDKDKIALPGIKTSHNAILLEMAAAKTFGDAQYAKLDPLTVGMPYPDALAAMLSDRTEIDSHFASAPFCFIEADHPGIHRVLDSSEETGNVTAIMAFAMRRFATANPKLIAAFVAALDQSTALIHDDEAKAVRIYGEMSKVRLDEHEIRRVVDDPGTIYTATPLGIMGFARFLHRIGRIPAEPARWQDLFVPEVQSRAGS